MVFKKKQHYVSAFRDESWSFLSNLGSSNITSPKKMSHLNDTFEDYGFIPWFITEVWETWAGIGWYLHTHFLSLPFPLYPSHLIGRCLAEYKFLSKLPVSPLN